MSSSIKYVPVTGANYFDQSCVYTVENSFDGSEENHHVEDWRQGWVKTGALVADGLPVIRIFNPQNEKDFALTRPYYLKNSQGIYKKDELDNKLIIFASPIFNYKGLKPKIGTEVCSLELIHTSPIGPKEAPKKDDKKSDGVDFKDNKKS